MDCLRHTRFDIEMIIKCTCVFLCQQDFILSSNEMDLWFDGCNTRFCGHDSYVIDNSFPQMQGIGNSSLFIYFLKL